MAQLPQLRRLLVEDFKNEKKWIGPLFLTVNNFMESVVNAFNKSLTLIDNTTSDIKTLTLSSVPSASSPAAIKWTKTNSPISVLVGNVVLTAGGAFSLTTAVQVQWAMSGTSLQITGLTGITPTSAVQYDLTLICIAG